MKILAINASPQGKSSTTTLLLSHFLKGAEEGGAEIEILYLNKLKINPCIGCVNCWIRKPRKCIFKDDMDKIKEAFLRGDTIIFSFPVYTEGVPGQLKIVWDRLIPLVPTFIEVRDDHCMHKLYSDSKKSKVLLITSCGFWEKDNFDLIISHAQRFFSRIGHIFLGALIRPHGTSLRLLKGSDLVKSVLKSATFAGSELASKGSISEGTKREISKQIMSRDDYLNKLNGWFQSVIDQFENQ